MVDFINLKNSLASKQFSVWVLFGNDAWIRDKALENIAATVDIGYPELNKTVIENGKDVDELFNICNTAPFMAPKRLVIAEQFVLPQGKKLNDFKQRLERLAVSTESECCLVFVYSEFTELVNVKGVEPVDCNRLSERDVVKWIVAYCKRMGKTIDMPAATMLAQFCLNDMARISNEAAKLCDYATTKIEPQDVENLVHKDAEYAVFDIGKEIANRNASKALDMVRNLTGRGEDVRSLFTVLYNYYRRLYYIRTTKYDNAQLASMLNVKEGAIRFAQSVADKYKPMQLRQALKLFLQADNKLKEFYNENDVLRTLILQLSQV